MKYATFNKTDFAADDYFIQWVHHPDAENCHFWETFLDNYPYKQEEVEAARQMVLQLSEKSSFGRLKDEIWEMVQDEIQSGSGRGRPLKKWYEQKGFFIAVGAACILGVSFFFINNMGLLEKEATPLPLQITLQLQDGSKQIIDETTSAVITTEGGQTLGNQNKHILVYEKSEQNATELVYNVLTVPYGKNFELVLADGSHIYLNAGSTLGYPVQFLPGKPRNVYLDGEAFFEVTKDDTRAFTVITEEMNTRVYGTKFNVTSYKNEGNTHAVLVEGSVGVYTPGDSTSQHDPLRIVPGQKATYKGGKIDVEKVEIYKYTAWTNGELYFLKDHFDLILRKLERHYNIKIINTYEALNGRRLTSSFKTGDSIAQVLEIFKRIAPFRYKRDGNTITILPPNRP